MGKPMKVSVLMLTYNQEKYVTKAIKSVLKQKANFSFELIIGEDCSTDNTAIICKEYAKKHPTIIKLFCNEKNLGLQQNFILNYNRCTGQYISICEGDDFFIYKKKLQIQVDILDQHPEHAACFHRVINYFQEDGSKSLSNGGQKKIMTVSDIIRYNTITNVSILYRRGLFGKLPEFFKDVKTYDHAIHILNAQYGTFLYLKKPMAVYRQIKGSIWAGTTKEKQILISIRTRELLMDHYFQASHPVYKDLLATWNSACAHLILFYRNNNRQKEDFFYQQEFQKRNKNSTKTVEEWVEKTKNEKKNQSLSKRGFLILKAMRRFVSRFIPYPSPY